MPNRKERPRLVDAPAPSNRAEKISLYAPVEFLRTLKRFSEFGKLAEFAALVHGGETGASGDELRDARILFQGLNRPIDDVELDEETYAYIWTPKATFNYPEAKRLAEDPVTLASAAAAMHYGVEPVERPDGHVFAVFARIPDNPDNDPDMLKTRADESGNRGGAKDAVGLIRYWAWIRASLDEPTLPDDHAVRFKRRVW